MTIITPVISRSVKGVHMYRLARLPGSRRRWRFTDGVEKGEGEGVLRVATPVARPSKIIFCLLPS